MQWLRRRWLFVTAVLTLAAVGYALLSPALFLTLPQADRAATMPAADESEPSPWPRAVRSGGSDAAGSIASDAGARDIVYVGGNSGGAFKVLALDPDELLRSARGESPGKAVRATWEVWPGNIAFSDPPGRLYVTTMSQGGKEWTATVIDASPTGEGSREIVSISASEPRGSSGGPAVGLRPIPLPDGNLYVLRQVHVAARRWEGSLERIDPATGAVRRAIPLGSSDAHGDSVWTGLSADGSRLVLWRESLVNNQVTGGRLIVIDPRTDEVRSDRSITGASAPAVCHGDAALSRDGHTLRCLGTFGGGLGEWRFGLRWVDVDRATEADRLELELPAPSAPEEFIWRFAESPDRRRLYFIRPLMDPAVVAIDLEQRRVVGTLTLPGVGRRASDRGSPSGRGLASAWHAWLGGRAEAKVLTPAAAAVSPDGARLFMTGARKASPGGSPGGNRPTDEPRVRGDGIWVVRADTLQIEAHLTPGAEFDSLAVSSDGRRLYAVGPAPDGRFGVIELLTGDLRWFSLPGFRAQGIERVVPQRAASARPSLHDPRWHPEEVVPV